MRQLLRWHQIPKLYRVLVILFAAVDVLTLSIAAAGLRSWFHGGSSVGQSIVFLLLLSPFFAPIPQRESSPHNLGGSSTWRIAAGIVFLFLSGWAIIGAVDQHVRGVELSDYVLESIVFVMFLTSMGALLVWRGWQRRRGMTWATFPPSKFVVPPTTDFERRGFFVGFVAAFIIGLAVLFSLNYREGPIAVQPYGWLVTSAGIAVAATLLIANRRSMRKARVCRRCGQHVPLAATVCPSCGRPFA